MTEHAQPDHRTRVAADRRARTRRRLIESAIPVFAEHGVDASVIDDVIAAAGVSRGTFYNYFQSNRELLLAVNDQLRDEMIVIVQETVAGLPDPAARVAASIGLVIQVARENPLMARFCAQGGLEAAGPDSLICGYLADQIQQGIGEGLFLDCSLTIAMDMVAGAVLFAFYRISHGGIGASHGPEVVTTILRGLGMTPQQAADLAARPLPTMDIHAASALMCSAAAQ
jgi:AcrR family transcriptional regulator